MSKTRRLLLSDNKTIHHEHIEAGAEECSNGIPGRAYDGLRERIKRGIDQNGYARHSTKCFVQTPKAFERCNIGRNRLYPERNSAARNGVSENVTQRAVLILHQP